MVTTTIKEQNTFHAHRNSRYLSREKQAIKKNIAIKKKTRHQRQRRATPYISKNNKKIKRKKRKNKKRRAAENIPPMTIPHLCTNQCVPHRPKLPPHWPISRPEGVPKTHTLTISNSVGTGNLPKIPQLKLRLVYKN